VKETSVWSGDLSRRVALVILGGILAARLLLGFAYSALNPLGEAPDEADHYAYAAYIGNEGRLPQGPEMTQSKHPPLYHILAAGLAKAIGAEMDTTFLRSNPDVGVTSTALAPNFFIHTGLESWPWRDGALSMHLGRLVSVLAGVVLTAATYALSRAIWPGWYAGPLAAAAFVAFLPESLFIGGTMSNDMLAAMCSALALWLALRARGAGGAILAGLAMGLAFLTKASTVGLWPVVCAAMLVNRPYTKGTSVPTENGQGSSCGSGNRRLRGPAVWAVIAGAVATLTALPWLWRNWRLYGDPLGWPLVLATIDRRQMPLSCGDLMALVRGWFVSFWGKTGGAGQLALPAPFYAAWVLLVLAAAAGGLIGWRRKDGGPARQVPPAGWIVLLGAPVMTVLSILSYSRVALGTDQGRLLYPALAPIAILLVLGIAGWLKPRGYRWLPVSFGAGMLSIALLVLGAGILLPFAPPPAPPSGEVAAATQVNEEFGGRLQLLAYRWGAAAEGGTTIPLTLYWSATQKSEEDLRAILRLTDASGDLVWEWKRSPGAGRFSTDRWETNRVIRDTYLVPADALDRAADIEVGIRPFPEGEWLPPGTKGNGSTMLRIEKPNP
jgi:hypothetical protein